MLVGTCQNVFIFASDRLCTPAAGSAVGGGLIRFLATGSHPQHRCEQEMFTPPIKAATVD